MGNFFDDEEDDSYVFDSDNNSNGYDGEIIDNDESMYNDQTDYEDGALSKGQKTKIGIITVGIGIVGLIILLLANRFLNNKPIKSTPVPNTDYIIVQEQPSTPTTPTTPSTPSIPVTDNSNNGLNGVGNSSNSSNLSESLGGVGSINNITSLNDSSIISRLTLDTVRNGTFHVQAIKNEVVSNGSTNYVKGIASGNIDGIIGKYSVEVPVGLTEYITKGESYNVTYSVYSTEDSVYVGNITFK